MIILKGKRKIIKKNERYVKAVVAGTEKGVGATHFSILIGNYYAEILGRKTAIVDLNRDDDYGFLEKVCIPEDSHQNKCYKIKKVTYYPGMTKERMAEVFQKDYECIIMDAGDNYGGFSNEISMCDKKFFIGFVNPWKIITSITEFNNTILSDDGMKWKYMYSLGDEESADYLKSIIRKRVYRIPIIPNPFKINGRQLSDIEQIIWEG